MKATLLFFSFFLLFSFTASSQIKQNRYKPKGLYKGNFGKYPSRLRIAPMLAFGSNGVDFKSPDPLSPRDTIFSEIVKDDPSYLYSSNNYKNGTQVAVGLMFDYPFGRNIVFRPSISYVTRNVKDETAFAIEDTVLREKRELNIANTQKISQLQTMFMLNAQFGSDWSRTRIFVGAGFGFAFNLNSSLDYSYNYLRANLDSSDIILEKVDTSGSVDGGIGLNPNEDIFTKLDMQAQGEIGLEFGNFLVSGYYNKSLGSILTDPRRGTYLPYSYGIKLAYIIGQKPDLWNR